LACPLSFKLQVVIRKDPDNLFCDLSPLVSASQDAPPYNLNLLSRDALVTTETELKAIAPAATTGFRSTWIRG